MRIFKRGALSLGILNFHYAVVIMEVLSESTEGYDRGKKLELYRGIETLKEYVLMNSRRQAVAVFSKNEEGFWVLSSQVCNLESTIQVPLVNLALPISEIYGDTENLEA
jgi:Uma2 family endonuclease